MGAAAGLARLIHQLGDDPPASQGCELREALDPIRGIEGLGAKIYFSVFQYMLKQQREDFRFVTRTRRPPRDRINCLLSFIYALVRHDCLAALTTAGLDPYVGWLHATRAGRPACALDLMEEFRPCLAERLALTLVNRRQILSKHFRQREGGAVELTDRGRREVIPCLATAQANGSKARTVQEKYPLNFGQVFSVQSKLLARKLRGDIPDYIPFILK